MAWTPPITNYVASNKVLFSKFNEIGENEIYLKDRADVVDAFIDQDVKETASPTFVDVTTQAINTQTIDTGQGSVECYPMNQGVRTSDSVTYDSITANGSILPTSSSVEGSISATTVGVIVPRGIYLIYNFVHATNYSQIQMNHSGTGGWGTLSSGQTGTGATDLSYTLISDGTNFRVRMTTSTQSLFYRKF
jgi:hypothetical protein